MHPHQVNLVVAVTLGSWNDFQGSAGMAEEESRTGDPAKDAAPLSKTDLKARLGCFLLILIIAVVIAVIAGMQRPTG